MLHQRKICLILLYILKSFQMNFYSWSSRAWLKLCRGWLLTSIGETYGNFCFKSLKKIPNLIFIGIFNSLSTVCSCNREQMSTYSIAHICQLSSVPSLCYLLDAPCKSPLPGGPQFLTVAPRLSEIKMQKCRLPHVIPLHNLLSSPSPNPNSLKRLSEVWQQVGDFWQVVLISWLGKKSAWQWRTCVHFRTSLNLSDPPPLGCAHRKAIPW